MELLQSLEAAKPAPKSSTATEYPRSQLLQVRFGFTSGHQFG